VTRGHDEGIPQQVPVPPEALHSDFLDTCILQLAPTGQPPAHDLAVSGLHAPAARIAMPVFFAMAAFQNVTPLHPHWSARSADSATPRFTHWPVMQSDASQ
jgi:hypothetical protein